MNLKDALKAFYQEKLKKAIAAGSHEEIYACEQVLRQYATYDIGSEFVGGHFTYPVLKDIRQQIVSRWQKSGFPPVIETMFLYGSWIKGTHSDSSELNVYISFFVFDKNNKKSNDPTFDKKKKIDIEDIRKKMLPEKSARNTQKVKALGNDKDKGNDKDNGNGGGNGQGGGGNSGNNDGKSKAKDTEDLYVYLADGKKVTLDIYFKELASSDDISVYHVGPKMYI